MQKFCCTNFFQVPVLPWNPDFLSNFRFLKFFLLFFFSFLDCYGVLQPVQACLRRELKKSVAMQISKLTTWARFLEISRYILFQLPYLKKNGLYLKPSEQDFLQFFGRTGRTEVDSCKTFNSVKIELSYFYTCQSGCSCPLKIKLCAHFDEYFFFGLPKLAS